MKGAERHTQVVFLAVEFKSSPVTGSAGAEACTSGTRCRARSRILVRTVGGWVVDGDVNTCAGFGQCLDMLRVDMFRIQAL